MNEQEFWDQAFLSALSGAALGPSAERAAANAKKCADQAVAIRNAKGTSAEAPRGPQKMPARKHNVPLNATIVSEPGPK